jgi:hypothetical protein
VLEPMWSARWAVLLRAGQSLLEPRLVTVPGGLQTEGEPHRFSWWAAHWRASPPSTWTESGQTPAVRESSSSPLWGTVAAPTLPSPLTDQKTRVPALPSGACGGQHLRDLGASTFFLQVRLRPRCRPHGGWGCAKRSPCSYESLPR